MIKKYTKIFRSARNLEQFKCFVVDKMLALAREQLPPTEMTPFSPGANVKNYSPVGSFEVASI